jgi:hypothetical protein
MEELMAWQPNPEWQDLNHSLITFTFEKFEETMVSLMLCLFLNIINVFISFKDDETSENHIRIVIY